AGTDGAGGRGVAMGGSVGGSVAGADLADRPRPDLVGRLGHLPRTAVDRLRVGLLRAGLRATSHAGLLGRRVGRDAGARPQRAIATAGDTGLARWPGRAGVAGWSAAGRLARTACRAGRAGGGAGGVPGDGVVRFYGDRLRGAGGRAGGAARGSG